MFINAEKEFIIPVKYVNIEEFDINEEKIQCREMTGKMDELSSIVEKKIQYLFFKVIDLSKVVAKEDIYSIYESVFKSILLAHINNVPCFKSIKDKDINGMNEEKALQVHLAKFKSVYDYHNNKFKCDMNYKSSKKALSKKDLEVKLKGIDNEINGIFKDLSSKISMLTIKEILNVHLLVFKTILNLLVENVPCFINAKKQLSDTAFQSVVKIHIVKFTEIFNSHVKLLKCS